MSEKDPAVDTLLGFFESGRALRGFEAGIQYALARILVDPQFIYRFERAPAGLGGARRGVSRQRSRAGVAAVVLPLEQHPGRGAAAVAAAGRLREPAVLEQQTRRMLADRAPARSIDNLAGQWLLLRQLDDVAPGTKEFDGNLRYAFRRETELLFETIVREDRSILDLIDADYTFVDERLARHYGIPNIRGSRFRRVALRRRRAPRPARSRQLPDRDVGRQPHVAGQARQVDPGEPARRAGAAAAARRGDESRPRPPPRAQRRRRCASGSSSTARTPAARPVTR